MEQNRSIDAYRIIATRNHAEKISLESDYVVKGGVHMYKPIKVKWVSGSRHEIRRGSCLEYRLASAALFFSFFIDILTL